MLYILELLSHIFHETIGLCILSPRLNHLFIEKIINPLLLPYIKFKNKLFNSKLVNMSKRVEQAFVPSFFGFMTVIMCVVFLLTTGCSSSGKPQVIERGSSSLYKQNKKNKIHVVHRGDTLFSIASYYGKKVSTLAKCNKLRHPYTIHPGQKIATTCSLNNNRIKSKQPHSSQIKNKKDRYINKKGKKSRNVEQVTVLTRWRWPTIGHVVRRFQPGNQGKTGLEIGGKYRQSIYAAEAGKVVYSGSGLIGYGKLIIVKHSKRFLTAYGYNSELLVKEGDSVKSGQAIAKMGRSPSNRAALFFELRKDGKPVNPMRYLPKK